MPLARRVRDEGTGRSPEDVAKEIGTAFFSDQNFFERIDEYIKEKFKRQDILNGVKNLLEIKPCLSEINSNPTNFDYSSEPEGMYSLEDDEIQLLRKINTYQNKLLGTTIGDLHKSTKVILCKRPQDCDLLGSYSVEDSKPTVRLYMDAIENEAKSSKCDRKFITAAVYIHEMMHRFYDVRPDLGWKQSVKEIEEPMAEFAKLSFCNEFNNKELKKVASQLTENLRNHKDHFYYAIGAELKNTDLIQKYRYVSLMMHKVNGNNIDTYIKGCTKDKLCDQSTLLSNLINQYAKWFPLEKYEENK